MSVPTSGSNAGIDSGSRFNGLPMFIGFGMVFLFLVGMVYAVSQRSNKNVASSDVENVFEFSDATETVDFIDDKPDGLVGVNRNDIGDAADAPGRVSRLDDKLAEWMENQQLQKLQRESQYRDTMQQKQMETYERALTASSKVEGFERRTRPGTTPYPDVILPASASGDRSVTSRDNRLAMIMQAAQQASAPAGGSATGGGASQIVDLINSPQAQALLGQLGAAQPASTQAGQQGRTSPPILGQAQPDEDEFVLRNSARAPRSPYEIKTGSIIPGAMISAANSDLPGDIVAQVTQSVYDSASGRFVLIPAGTKLFGRYDAYTALGQERLLIAWNRLVFPDGETFDIGGMQGYDGRGMSGFKDKVNTHFLRTLGNALLLSLVSASGEALVASVNGPDTSVFNLNLAQDFSDTTSQAFNEYLRNRLRIQPTLEIRSGYRFNIIVARDINFDGPYERGFAAYRADN